MTANKRTSSFIQLFSDFTALNPKSRWAFRQTPAARATMTESPATATALFRLGFNRQLCYMGNIYRFQIENFGVNPGKLR
jgi:hypothetical protein